MSPGPFCSFSQGAGTAAAVTGVHAGTTPSGCGADRSSGPFTPTGCGGAPMWPARLTLSHPRRCSGEGAPGGALPGSSPKAAVAGGWEPGPRGVKAEGRWTGRGEDRS